MNYYNIYGNNRFPQPVQPMQQMQPMPNIPQPSPPQPNQDMTMTNCDFIKVSGPKVVEDYIVNAGWTVYFLDNDKPIMYVKQKTSEFGPTSTKYYKVDEISVNDVIQMFNEDPLTKANTQPTQSNDISLDEFNSLKKELEDHRASLDNILKTLNGNCVDIQNLQDMVSKTNMRNRRDSYESTDRQPAERPDDGNDKRNNKRIKSGGNGENNGNKHNE